MASPSPFTNETPAPVQAQAPVPSSEARPEAFHAATTPGLPNSGNTCYANAGLKFVLYAFGEEASTRALAPESAANSTQTPSDLIRDCMRALSGQGGQWEERLTRLFAALQTAPEFPMFSNAKTSEQHDATSFVEGLVKSLELDALSSHQVRLYRRVRPGDSAEALGDPTCMVSASLDGSDQRIDLQSVLDRKLMASAGDATSQYGFQGIAVDDMAQLKGFVLRLTYAGDAADAERGRLPAPNIDYNSQVTLRMTELSVEPGEYDVTLAPVTVIVHLGTASAGHYLMYRKTEMGWERHDDGVVSDVQTIPAHERPVMIGFRVMDKRWTEPAHGQSPQDDPS